MTFVPKASGSGGGSSPATVVTTAAGLPAGTDGKLAVLRVGTWPDTEYIELTYDANAGHWFSRPYSLLAFSDQAYLGNNTTTYGYVQVLGGLAGVPGGTTGPIGWDTRPIRQASALLASGLTLQAVATCIMGGNNIPSAYSVQARFFQHNDGDAVVFSADGSTAVAELGTQLVSPAATTAVFKSTGWAGVVQLGTSNPITSTQVTKANLWPRLYGKIGSGATYGSIIDTDIQYRWVV